MKIPPVLQILQNANRHSVFTLCFLGSWGFWKGGVSLCSGHNRLYHLGHRDLYTSTAFGPCLGARHSPWPCQHAPPFQPCHRSLFTMLCHLWTHSERGPHFSHAVEDSALGTARPEVQSPIIEHFPARAQARAAVHL
jgi:hypothetical protein